MAIKLARNVLPVGFQVGDFRYQGVPVSMREQLDQACVGIVEMVPPTRGDARAPATYFHVGVVAARSQWFVYIEWAAVGGRSWTANQPKPGLEFMFVRCRDEVEARAYFRQECLRMQLQHRYSMQAPSRAHGLPQEATPAANTSGGANNPRPGLLGRRDAIEPAPQVVALAEKLIRGTLLDARASVQDQGLIPTREAVEQLGEELLPLVIERLSALAAGGSVHGRRIHRTQLGLVAAN